MFRGIHRTDDDIVRFDCDASFVPKDVDDLQTGKDERNSRIVLSTRIGRGVVAVDVPVLVKEISFHGTVSIQLKLMSGYPYVKILTLGMPRAPRVDFVLKPLKGVDLMDTPGLSNFMHSLIDQIIAMLFVTPNSLVLDLDALLNYVVGL